MLSLFLSCGGSSNTKASAKVDVKASASSKKSSSSSKQSEKSSLSDTNISDDTDVESNTDASTADENVEIEAQQNIPWSHPMDTFRFKYSKDPEEAHNIMLDTFDTEFKNVTNYLKEYSQGQEKEDLLSIYKTLDDVFGIISTYENPSECDDLVTGIESKFIYDLKKSDSYSNYQKHKIENMIYLFTNAFSYLQKYKLYMQAGKKQMMTSSKNDVIEVITKIKKFFYDYKMLNDFNQSDKEETVLMLEWIINESGAVDYATASYRAKMGDVYGVLYFLNHVFKDKDISGLLIEFGTFRVSFKGTKDYVTRSRYKLYEGNLSNAKHYNVTVSAKGFDLEDVFSDAMGKLSTQILQKIVAEASKSEIVTKNEMEKLYTDKIWRGSKAVVISCKRGKISKKKLKDKREMLYVDFYFDVAKID